MELEQNIKVGESRQKIALVYRYSINDHAELYPVIPGLLKKLGEKFDTLYIGAKYKGTEYDSEGVQHSHYIWKVNRANFHDKLIKSLLYYLWLPMVGLKLRFWGADLIWIDESIPVAGRVLQIFSGRPVAVTLNDFFVEVYGSKYSLLRFFSKQIASADKKCWQKARGIVTRTASMKNYLVKQGVEEKKIKVVRDAVIPDLFQPVDASEQRKKLGFSDDDVVICHHGILHPNKGMPRVLEWMLPLMKENKHLKFMVIGEGPDAPVLRELVKSNGLENQVVFAGWLADHSEVNMHLNAADIGLVMRVGQYSDHFHVTGALIHCMMSGLPVLSARLEGIQEIVTDGEEGYLFDPVSGDEFANKLKLLIADQSLRKRMGGKARERSVVEFNVSKVTDESVKSLISFL